MSTDLPERVTPDHPALRTSHVQVTLSPGQRKRALVLAERRGMKLATFIRHALMQHMEAEGVFDPASPNFIPPAF